MLERRVRDFRLDSRLIRYCQPDIVQLCGLMDAIGDDQDDLKTCLQVGGHGVGGGVGGVGSGGGGVGCQDGTLLMISRVEWARK